MTKLWEAHHDYYCSAQDSETFESWAEFLDEYGDADKDYNLVFRWDWNTQDDELETLSDDEQLLSIFVMQQRKGNVWQMNITVSRDDEPSIREWLQTRWEHLQNLWSPFK